MTLDLHIEITDLPDNGELRQQAIEAIRKALYGEFVVDEVWTKGPKYPTIVIEQLAPEDFYRKLQSI